jgi:hypothetical protein
MLLYRLSQSVEAEAVLCLIDNGKQLTLELNF